MKEVEVDPVDENPIVQLAKERSQGFNSLLGSMLFELDAMARDGTITEQVCAVMGEKLITLNHDLLKRIMITERQKRL